MFESNDYRFYCYQYSTYHHTDVSHGADIHYLAMLNRGSARIRTDRETIHIASGDIFYIPRGLCYHSFWHGEPEIEFISFGFLTMPARDQKSYLPQVLPHNDELAKQLQQIPLEGRSVSSQTLSLFYAALAVAVQQMTYNQEGQPSGIADRAMAYIRKHPFAQIPEIANACGVSQPHLYACFREETSYSPNRYRQQILCERAMELLTTTDLTVQAISEQLHFSSPSYFRKVFFRYAGQTPRQFAAHTIKPGADA